MYRAVTEVGFSCAPGRCRISRRLRAVWAGLFCDGGVGESAVAGARWGEDSEALLAAIGVDIEVVLISLLPSEFKKRRNDTKRKRTRVDLLFSTVLPSSALPRP